MRGTSNRHARVVAAVLAIGFAQVLLILVFAWSSSRAAPHDLPVVAAGPQQQVQAVVAGIGGAQPGAFDMTVVPDEQAARSAVTSRGAYGAIVLGPHGVSIYTASAASGAVAQSLAQAVPDAVHRANPQAQVTVTDLVPAPVEDPHGSGLAIAFIPLAITSIAAGAAIALLASGRRARLMALVGYAIVAGLLSTWALQTMLGVLTGAWMANAATLALATLSIAAATAGLAALLGVAGIAVAAVVIFFLGLPFSGVTSAWQLIPTPWGWLAQGLPVGAANTAVRSVAFFNGQGGSAALILLGLWAVVGLLLAGILPGRRANVGTGSEVAST
jgi:hypothetical protein